MPLNDWIDVKTTTTPAPPPPPDTPRTFAMVAEAVPATFTARFERYSSIGELDDAGWTGSETAYLAIADLFAQAATITLVSSIVMIRRDPAVAEEWSIDVTGTTDGDFKLFDDGVEISTFTASTSTAENIKDGLIAGLIAGYTGATVDTDTLTVTQDLAGIPIILSQTSPVGNTELDIGAGPTIASVGIYDDLDAAYPLAPFWGVLAPAATDPENDEARRWVQADTTTRRSFLLAESADAGIFDSGDTDNLAVTWLTAKYNRVNLLSHTVATDYIQASMVGRMGGSFPGSRAWHYLDVTGHTVTAGISPRTTSATATLKTRRCSYTERLFGPAGDLLVLNGTVPKSGEFVYHRWAEDWTWYTLRVTVDGVMKSAGGVNLDEAGLQGLADAVKVALVPLVDNAVIAADYTVSFVPLAQVPAGELAIGDYKTTGAILVAFTVTPKLRALRVSVAIALV